MASLIGQTIGNYEIESLLGEGGMAYVYCARHRRLNRRDALKMMKPALASQTSFRERFEREAQAAAALTHENIVRVYDFGEQDAQYYLAMELVADGTLTNLLRQTVASGQLLPLKQGLLLLAQAGNALAYAHSQGVLHRDVKPDNMLLNAAEAGSYTLKLSDFGLARLATGQATTVGMIVGTPAYMSPEQFEAPSQVDRRSDIYSLGIVLYEVATGRVPYDTHSIADAAYKHVHVPLPAPRLANPNLPAEVENIIQQCLAKDPNNRYQQASELISALRTAAAMLPSQDTGARVPGVSPAPNASADMPTKVVNPPGQAGDNVTPPSADAPTRIADASQTAPPQDRPTEVKQASNAVPPPDRPDTGRRSTSPGEHPPSSLRVYTREGQSTLFVPGQPSTFFVTFQNDAAVPIDFDISVEGVPAAWVQVNTWQLRLGPYESRDLPIRIAVPNEPGSRAGDCVIIVNAKSSTNAQAFGSVNVRCKVQSFAASSIRIAPASASSTTRARFKVKLNNTGNIPASFRLHGRDEEATLTFAFSHDGLPLDTMTAPLELGAAQEAVVDLTVSAPSHVFGLSRDYRFAVQSETLDGTPSRTVEAHFMHLPMIPIWLPPAVLMLIAIVVGIITLLPKGPAGQNLPAAGVPTTSPVTPSVVPPTASPTIQPTHEPTRQPADTPTDQPTVAPTAQPTTPPTAMTLPTVAALPTTYIASTTDPFPRLDRVDVPSSVKLGEPFEIELYASNLGTDARGGGSMSLSFPDQGGSQTVDEVTILNADAPIVPITSGCTLPSGQNDHTARVFTNQTKCNTATIQDCGSRITLNYPIAELWHKPWSSASRHHLKVHILPRPDVSQVIVYVRVSLLKPSVVPKPCSPMTVPSASEANATDQQGFPVQAVTINIQ